MSSQLLIFLPLSPLSINPPFLPCPLPEPTSLDGVVQQDGGWGLAGPGSGCSTLGGSSKHLGAGGGAPALIRLSERGSLAPGPIGVVAADPFLAAVHLFCQPLPPPHPGLPRVPRCGRASWGLGKGAREGCLSPLLPCPASTLGCSLPW